MNPNNPGESPHARPPTPQHARPPTPQHARPATPQHARPVTPQDIRSVTFHPSPIAWRGYSGPEVKQALDVAADALQEIRAECAGLEAEVERLRNFYRNNPPESITAAPTPGSEGYGVLATLRRYAATQVQHASDYADRTTDRLADADQALRHARVRTAIVAQAAVYETGSNQAEVEQARWWVSSFAHALRTYVATMYEAIAHALARSDPHRGGPSRGYP